MLKVVSLPNGICLSNKSNYLITGGAGFVGSHLVDDLIVQNQNVIIIDDLSTGFEYNINEKAIFYKLSLSKFKKVESIIRKHKIDFVIHQAAKINLNVKLEDPLLDIQSSVLNTINLLKCSVKFKIKKFIYASSVAVYGRTKEIPVDENSKLRPVYSYGIAKKCSEDYIRYYNNEYGLNYTILRYSNIYGPRQPIFGEVGLIAIYVDNIKKISPW